MHAEMRSLACRTLSCLALVLLLLLLVGRVSAGESVTTLANKTITVTGTWEKNMDARIPFSIDDFTGFRYFNLSYQINTESTQSVASCGLAFLLTTDEYWAARKNGSGLVYVPLSESMKVFNGGFITFDPRTNPEPSWQKGKYWLFVNIKPANCVNVANIRLDLVRDTVGITTTGITTPPTAPPQAATIVAAARETTPPSPAMTVQEPATLPGAIQTTAVPGTTEPAPTKPPLPGYIPVLAVILSILVLGGKPGRR